MNLPPCDRPTLHFIGVTTGQSSIMKVFPAWARHLGIGDAVIRGIDLAPRSDPALYREVVAFLRDDPLTRGALVTTHKIDLFQSCRDMFDDIDRFARLMNEASCLSKPLGRLAAQAKDPISAGLTIDGFLGPDHFARTGGAACVLGAGGAALAITWHLLEGRADRPAHLTVTDRSPERLAEMRHLHAMLGSPVPVDYVLAADASPNDRAVAALPPGSLVVNATGLGKDAPGSPLAAPVFPEGGVAWELNYRGDLVFLDQARAQAAARRLRVEDGWTYFIHGWTQVIAEVFAIPIDTGPDSIAELTRLANAAKG